MATALLPGAGGLLVLRQLARIQPAAPRREGDGSNAVPLTWMA